MFLEQGAHLPSILLGSVSCLERMDSFLASGHAAMLAFLNDVTHINQWFGEGNNKSLAPSALSAAARSGSLRVMQSVWGPWCSDFCAPMIASAFANGHADVAGFLLSKISAADVTSHIKEILLLGARLGTVEVAELLVPFMDRLNDLRSIIMVATEAGNVELASFWIRWQRGRTPELSLDAILLTSIWTSDLSIARLIGPPGPELLLKITDIAIEVGFLEGVKYASEFLPASERVFVVEQSMPKAVNAPSPAIASFFLEQPARGAAPLMTAVKLGQAAFLARMLSHATDGTGVNILTSEGTPLTLAVALGNLSVIEVLLAVPGLDGMMPDAQGNSPFVVACRESSSDVWKIIADFCGDVLQEDYHQVNTGFFLACQRPKVNIQDEIIPLFSRFTDLDPNFMCSSTSIFVHARTLGHSGQTELLKWLLSMPGINVNDRDRTGSTALIQAAAQGRRSLFQPTAPDGWACLQLLLDDSRVY
jgi:hypothetical protein